MGRTRFAFSQSVASPPLNLFPGKQGNLREMTIGGGVSPERCHQRILRELDIGVGVAPERGDGGYHPGGGSQETKEDQAALETPRPRSVHCFISGHGHDIVNFTAAGEPDFSLAFSTKPFYNRGAMAVDKRNPPEDPTPIIAAPTDVAPLTHAQPKPPHERISDGEADVIDWES